MQKVGLPWPEVVSKVLPKPMSLEEVKAWRTKEAAAGRPSSYEDFCRAHSLCLTCLGEGVTYNDNGLGRVAQACPQSFRTHAEESAPFIAVLSR